jgi:DNA-binding NtrC family response regulator
MPNKVMVVEDDELLRTLTAAIVEECGLEAIEAESGDQAERLLVEEADEISAVMTDVRLPGQTDGVALASLIAERWPHIRILVTSAYAPSEQRRVPSGIEFMSKPWISLDVIKFVLRSGKSANVFRH